MSIDGISGSGLIKDMMHKTLEEQLKEVAEELNAEAAALPQDAYQGLSSKEWDPRDLYAVESGSMTGNFMKANKEQSRYATSLIDGFKSDQSVMAEMDALVSAMAPVFNFSSGKDTTYVEAAIGPARAERLMRRRAHKETMESAEETNLKEAKEELAKKTAELQAPKDANGDPLAYAVASDPNLEASDIAPEPASAADVSGTGGGVATAYETIGSMASAPAAAVVVDMAAPASTAANAAVDAAKIKIRATA